MDTPLDTVLLTPSPYKASRGEAGMADPCEGVPQPVFLAHILARQPPHEDEVLRNQADVAPSFLM